MRTDSTDYPVSNGVILSLLTGVPIEDTAQNEVYALASHLLEMVVDKTNYDEVRWICDASLRAMYHGSPITSAPAYGSDETVVSQWVRDSASFVDMDEITVMASLRQRLSRMSDRSFTTLTKLFGDHPIALVDLLALLTKLRDPGFTNRVMDLRALASPLPIEYGPIMSDLSHLGVQVTGMPFGDWCELLRTRTRHLLLVVDLVEVVNMHDEAQMTGRPPVLLPHPKLIALLMSQRDLGDDEQARTQAHDALRRARLVPADA